MTGFQTPGIPPRLHLFLLSLRTGPVDLNPVPLGQVPSLHPLRRPVVPIPSELKDLCSMASQVLLTCPTARQHAGWDYGLRPSPARLAAGLPASHCQALPAPAHGAYAHAAGLRLRGAETGTRAIVPAPLAFPFILLGRHSRAVISELNTAPMRSPANASPRHHWSSAHSSGPGRIATPYPVEDLTSLDPNRSLTSYSMPVSPALSGCPLFLQLTPVVFIGAFCLPPFPIYSLDICSMDNL